MQLLCGDTGYSDWLRAKTFDEHNRRVAYNRIKELFSEQIKSLRGVNRVMLPGPIWSTESKALKPYKKV